jgi:hypothetical protein
MLKLLRPEKRVEQIDQDNNRHDKSEQIFHFHSDSLQTIAAAHVEPRDKEEENSDNDKDNVGHRIAPKFLSVSNETTQRTCHRLFVSRFAGSDKFRPAMICNLQDSKSYAIAICNRGLHFALKAVMACV